MNETQPAAAVKRRLGGKSVPDILLDNALYIVMFFAIIYIAVRNPTFLSIPSIVNIIALASASLPAALGIAGCIVLTGTDLSAGRIVGLAACVSASLLQTAGGAFKMWPNLGVVPIPLVILLVMIMCACFGAFNGFFVARFKLHPFIVTLGTQLIIYTLLLLYMQAGSNNGVAISNLDQSYKSFISGSFVSIPNGTARPTPVPNYVWIAVILTAVMWFIWNKTTFGKNMFALGSNEEAARVSGVNVFLTTIMVFAMAGAMYAITGFIDAARIGSNTANTGYGYELDAIAACVIGGVSFVGGIGKIRGIIMGVFMLRLIFVGLTAISVPADLQYLIKGAIILFACAIDMRKYLAKK